MSDSINLGSELEAFVAEMVASGQYRSKLDVIGEGVRLLQEREAQLSAIDAAISRGIADLDAGRSVPAEEVFDRLRAKYQALVDAQG
jgi:antitoxin ParD1/3/4